MSQFFDVPILERDPAALVFEEGIYNGFSTNCSSSDSEVEYDSVKRTIVPPASAPATKTETATADNDRDSVVDRFDDDNECDDVAVGSSAGNMRDQKKRLLSSEVDDDLFVRHEIGEEGEQQEQNEVAAAAEDPLKDWDPMREQYHSRLNYAPGVEDDTPEIATLLGETVCRVFECPVNDRMTGSCWKKGFCYFAHPMEGDETPLLQPPVVKRESLPEKSLVGKGAHIPVSIAHFNDPHDFYVIPTRKFQCICGCGEDDTQAVIDKEESEMKIKKNRESMSTFDLLADMKAEIKKNRESMSTLELIADISYNIGYFLSLKMTKYQTDRYVADQLVACFLEIDNEMSKQWYRGIVLEDTTASVTLKIARVPVQLIDHGMKLDVPFVHCAALPISFTVHPPLAYHCSLFGVVPLLGRFTKRALTLFEEFVRDKELLLVIEDTVFPREQVVTKNYIFEDPPYYVDLKYYVQRQQTEEELEEQGDTSKSVQLQSMRMKMINGLPFE